MENRIGEARREYAARVGKFTQADAAKFFGVSLSTYKKWEQGQGMMNGEQLREIAMKYDVSTDFLLGRKINYGIVELPKSSKLSPDEQELVDIMRSMSAQGQQQLLLFARGCRTSFPKNHHVCGSEKTA